METNASCTSLVYQRIQISTTRTVGMNLSHLERNHLSHLERNHKTLDPHEIITWNDSS